MLQHEFEDINMALGENIRRLRRDKQWTQGELAEKSGVKVGHVSKLERNESDPKLETLQKLMNAFVCSSNALLNDVQTTPIDGLIEMAIERVQQLPDKEKTHLLDVIDKYCIAISMQGLIDGTSKTMMGFGRFAGKTEELAPPEG